MIEESIARGAAVVAEPEEGSAQSFRRLVATFLRRPLPTFGAALILLTILFATVGPVAWRVQYGFQGFTRLQAPSLAHPAGTDELGRDMLARLMHGAQVSLVVSSLSIAVALAVGTALAVVAVVYGGALGVVILRLVDAWFAMPGLILAILVAGLLGPSRASEVIAIGAVYVPAFARVSRSVGLGIMSMPYVEAARALGCSRPRLIVTHLFRGLVPQLLVMTTIYAAGAVLAEASLGYLGLGIAPPEPSWGNMLSDARSYMQLAPTMAFFPGAAITLVVLGLSLAGDGLRDLLDPHMQ